MDHNIEQVLARQLELNRGTWAALVDRGVDEETMLSLDFLFTSPGESEAQSLVEFLQRETDYEISVESVKKGRLSRRTWVVVGKTNPTAVSLDILDQWVGWMVAAGSAASCQFDGWGTSVPARS